MNKLFEKRNVIAVGKGYKKTNKVTTGERSIVVIVKKKLPLSELNDTDIIPRTFEGLSTDVIESNEFNALRLSRHRPMPGGVSGGHYKVTAGTVNGLEIGGYKILISNNHVIANCNDSNKGDRIWQPSNLDGGNESDTIALLEKFVPIKFYEPSNCLIANFIANICNSISTLFNRSTKLQPISKPMNKVDCAYGIPINDEDILLDVLEIGKPKGFNYVNLGHKIKKSGRTSGLTEGVVEIIEAEVQVNYGKYGTAYFDNQIITTKIADPGDSGSFVLNLEDEIIGLLFAGSDTLSIVNDISDVLFELDLI